MHKIRTLLNDVILFDMTNLLAVPIRTGIQRVTHQLSLYWPHNRPVLPFVQRKHDRVALLAPEILNHTERHFSSGHDFIDQLAKRYNQSRTAVGEAIYRMKFLANEPLIELDSVIAARESRATLSLELSMQTDFYGRLAREVPDKVYFLHYDYILWLNPEFFQDVDWTLHGQVSEWIPMMRGFKNHAFISRATRHNYQKYIDPAAPESHPIIIPGADGLGKALRDNVGERAEFVIIGTIEPRKQNLMVMRAIEAVQARGIDVSLTIVGKMGWLMQQERQEFDEIVARNSRIVWLNAPTDDVLTTTLRRARASIFMSRTEGFGGPPVESLSLGVPVIVSNTTPSILDLPNLGQIRLSPDDFKGLCDAIAKLANPAEARAKQNEIANLRLPTWRDFIVGISDWFDASRPMQGPTFTMRSRLDAMALSNVTALRAPVDIVFPTLFRVAFQREPSALEIDTWLDYAKEEEIDTPAFVAQFLSHAARRRLDAIDLFAAAFSGGDGPTVLDLTSHPADARMADLLISIIADSDLRRAVRRIYRCVLGRSGSPEEIAAWASAVDGGFPRQQMAYDAIHCDEYHARFPGRQLSLGLSRRFRGWALYSLLADIDNGDDEAFVKRLYKLGLHREPDLDGLAHYPDRLKQGESRSQIALELLLSQEASEKDCDIDTLMAVILSLAAPDLEGTADCDEIGNTDAVDMLRDLQAATLLSYWQADDKDVAALLASDEAAEGAVARETKAGRIAALAEALPMKRLGNIEVVAWMSAVAYLPRIDALLSQPVSDDDFITAAYRELFHRTADPEGRRTYQDELARGMLRYEMINVFLDSEEGRHHLGKETARWLLGHLIQRATAAVGNTAAQARADWRR